MPLFLNDEDSPILVENDENEIIELPNKSLIVNTIVSPIGIQTCVCIVCPVCV